jgi:DNA-binding NarL/FixJ family response regulator
MYIGIFRIPFIAMVGERLSLAVTEAIGSRASIQDFKRLFIGGESRFLLACLSTGFNPSFIYVGKSNLNSALAYKAIKVTTHFLGGANSSSQALDLLGKVKPGYIFVHESAEQPQYEDLIKYVSQFFPAIRLFVFIDSLRLLEIFTKIDPDVIVADSDIFLPVNPLFQGLMAIIAGTTYRSPSIVSYLKQLSLPIHETSSHRIVLSLRDQQLLEAYVLGLSNREVAEHLNLSVRSVQTYSGQLLARLGVNNRQKALMRIAKMGISVIPRFFKGESI